VVSRTETPVSEIWNLLAQVPDPEIPVISVVDLGIVRHVSWRGDECEITVTPTYSGCPATSVIEMEIQRVLRENGIDRVSLKRRIFPPWTTEWLSDKGRDSLERYGIAPPRAAGEPEKCPQCGAVDLELVSRFGSTPCKAQWRCRDCLEPFDYFKCI